MSNKIDFVVSWINDSDPKWIEDKNRYFDKTRDTSDLLIADCRYRDWGFLRYCFRSIDKYAPWVNKIHFITYGHIPEWLNTNHEKLNIIKHSDYIPAEYLPTFNSNVIELNIHRIKDLSEYFVLFNDDLFLNDYVSKKFFFKNNLPRGSAILTPTIPSSDFSYIVFNNNLLLNKHFDKQKVIKENFWKFFNFRYHFHNLRNLIFNYAKKITGFREYHTANALLKSTLEEIWEKESLLLDKICKNKFRSKEDVNQWLIKNWQFMQGKFQPINPDYTHSFAISTDNSLILKALKEKKYKVICINDTNMDFDFEKAKAEILASLEQKFSQKSSFELD